MELICSAMGICAPERPGQGIADIANAGFEGISLDISMYCPEYELECHGRKRTGFDKRDKNPILENPSEMGRCFETMLNKCREKGLNTLIARAPYLPRDTKRDDLNELLFRLSEESIKLCGKAGCKYIIIRPLFAGIEYGKEWDANREYYLRLAQIARENGVMILLENQCRSLNGHLVRGICSDGTVAAKWVDELNRAFGKECFGFCMDVGVCSLCGQDMYEFIHILGKRVKAVVVRDCNGHDESAQLPFTCASKRQSQTDWLSFIRGLREISFDGVMVLNMADTASVFSPLLRPQLMALAKEVMEYFKFQIEIESVLRKYRQIVLFGAGNMCRNYMKCYGEQYPPLFTCDNNKALWGTSFCGLEVRPPQALQELPDDCGVLICNVYYREIEQQLRDMGVKNVAYFNDEYMPSFHFDRISREK